MKNKDFVKPISIPNLREISESIRRMSEDQRVVFDIINKYAKTLIRSILKKDKKPEPPRLVIMGGAGSGKSFIIDTISNWLEHLFSIHFRDDYGRPFVLKAAPTGKAANVIKGVTLHSAFNLPFGNAYTSMSDSLRDSYR